MRSEIWSRGGESCLARWGSGVGGGEGGREFEQSSKLFLTPARRLLWPWIWWAECKRGREATEVLLGTILSFFQESESYLSRYCQFFRILLSVLDQTFMGEFTRLDNGFCLLIQIYRLKKKSSRWMHCANPQQWVVVLLEVVVRFELCIERFIVATLI